MSLYRKYRPQTFADLVGQEHVKRTILNQSVGGTIAHAYLLTGPRGVGKTTVARLVAKAANCEALKGGEPCNACAACVEIGKGAAMDVMEIDAASHTGVDNVRENILESVRFAPSRLKRKVFIIDEVHMLSTGAFNALLKTLEEPPPYALFILATTEIHKVPETIVSRCQRFDFRRIPATQMVERLKGLVAAEGAEADEAVLADIARMSEGCARDAESLLGQVLALGKKVDRETASLVLPTGGTEFVLSYLEAVAKDDAAEAVRLVGEFLEQGVDMEHFTDECVALLRQLLFLRLGNAAPFTDAYGEEVRQRADTALAAFDVPRIREAIEEFLTARRSMRNDKIPPLGLELAAVKLCRDFPKREVDSGRAEKDESGMDDSDGLLRNSPSAQTVLAAPSEPSIPSVGGDGKEKEEEPPPIEAEAVIADGVPVVSIDEVKRKWPQVFAQLKECNASLPFMVQAGEVSGVDGDEVELAVAYELYADQLNQDKNRKLIEGIMHQVIGKKLRIVTKHRKGEEEKDETVLGLVSDFGGSVVG